MAMALVVSCSVRFGKMLASVGWTEISARRGQGGSRCISGIQWIHLVTKIHACEMFMWNHQWLGQGIQRGQIRTMAFWSGWWAHVPAPVPLHT